MGAPPRRVELPPLTTARLREFGLVLPGLEEVTVELSRSSGHKWHVPVPQAAGWTPNRCRHATREPGQQTQLMEAFERVCLHCRRVLPVTREVEAGWQAAWHVVQAQAGLRRHRGDDSPRTWLGYARARAEAPVHHDAAVRALLARLTGELAADHGPLERGWDRALRESEEFLADYRAQAPATPTAAAVSAAGEGVLKKSTLREQADTVARIAGLTSRSRSLDWLAELVVETWKDSRVGTGSAAAVKDDVITAVGQQLDGRPVRDVSLLPVPSRTAPRPGDSVAAWAQREYDHLWRGAVADWIDLLEQAYQSPPDPPAPAGEQLIVVHNAPLTRDIDRDLAYLSQYRQLGPALPAGRRPLVADGWIQGTERCFAVVLQVPVFAARHAAELAENHPDQSVTLGPEVPAGAHEEGSADVVDRQVRSLARLAFPFLPEDVAEDVAADGRRPTATATVQRARAQIRARGPLLTAAPDEDLGNRFYNQVNEFLDGHRTWVPEDGGRGDAVRLLRTVVKYLRQGSGTALVVETGPRPATDLHLLTGDLLGLDTDEHAVLFSPAGGHEALPVPLHRVVSLTGHRDTWAARDLHQGAGHDPGWSTYTPPPG